jgi:antimicrobial peptide system SdpB family protein
MLRLLEALGERFETAHPADLWNPVYGLARSLLALGTAGTLAFTGTEVLFHPVVGAPKAPYCFEASRVSLFCVVPSHEIARWLGVALLLVVATGWRPSLTALPHWWISFSLQNSATVVDGGDQATAVLTLLLLPLALSDPRKWHWTFPIDERVHSGRQVAGFVGRLMMVIQIAGLNFCAAISKLGVPEWANGTALYYWITDPTFGPPRLLGSLLGHAVLSPTGVVVLTWGTIVLELAIALSLGFPHQIRRALVILGIGFHGAIAATMGLVSFGFAMSAALLLYLPSSRLGTTSSHRSLSDQS